VGDEELCAVGVEGYRRAVPVTTKSASQQPHLEHTSRSRQLRTEVAAPYRAAISPGSDST